MNEILSKQNTNLQQKIEELEDFYSYFWNLKFPKIALVEYFNLNIKEYRTIQFYVTNFKDISRLLQYNKKNKIYISVFDKIPKYSVKKKQAVNAKNNSRSTDFFVVDIDANYAFTKKQAENIIKYLKFKGIFKDHVYPTAIIHSGCGFHFYFKIQNIYLYKAKHSDFFENMYKKAVIATRDALAKNLQKIKKDTKIGHLTRQEMYILESLRADTALCGSTTQLIRAVGSYNKESNTTAEIISFNKNIKYSLGELIYELDPKYNTPEYKNYDYTKQINIIDKKKKNKKKKIKKQTKEKYKNKNDAVITLNKNRLIGIKKLTEYRLSKGSIEGTRQKIMCQVAWCCQNINRNANYNKIDTLNTLIEYGAIIGAEFAKVSYCVQKERDMARYEEKRPMLTNKTIRKWLEITKAEEKYVPELADTQNCKLTNTQKYIRKQKRDKKIKEIEEIKNMLKKGYTIKEVANLTGKNRNTISRYKKM